MTVHIRHGFADTTQYVYQPEGQQFVVSSFPASAVPAGSRRGEMYRERFHLVQHLLLKGENFVRAEQYGSTIATSGQASSGSCENFVIPRISLTTPPSQELSSLLEPPAPRKLSLFEIFEGVKFPLTPVESLPGSKGVAFALGFLIQPEQQRFALEGLTLSVTLDLSQAEWSDDYITLHALVLVKGKMDGNIFRVAEIAYPPIARRELSDLPSAGHKSVAAAAGRTGRGRGSSSSSRSLLVRAAGGRAVPESQAPATAGAAADDHLGIIVSEFRLDMASNIERLERILLGFAEAGGKAPDVVVLMGSFASRETAAELKQYQSGFSRLIDLLAKHKTLLEECEVVLVPGPNDPGQQKLLPRFPIDRISSMDISGRAKQLGLRLTLATNPCRVKVGGRELALFREELTDVLSANRVGNLGLSDAPEFELTAQSLLSQLHLYPVSCVATSAAAKAVMWDFDSALRLNPMPHGLVVGETRGSAAEVTRINGCQVARAPAFAETGEFLVFYGDSIEVSQAG